MLLDKLTMMRVRLILLGFLLINITVVAQRPEYVLPGETKSFSPDKDTLWVITGKQYKQTIIAKEQLKICNKQLDVYKQMTDTLKEEIKVLKDKNDLLVQDRDFYVKNWKEAESDVTLLADMNKKQTIYTQIAIGVGIVTTIAAFFGGFLLAH